MALNLVHAFTDYHTTATAHLLKELARQGADFAGRPKAIGLSVTEFQRRSVSLRNVIFNLSKDQAPLSPAVAEVLNSAFYEAACVGLAGEC